MPFLESAAARPKLKLLPRSVKEPVNVAASAERNAAIFGTGKPREMKDGDLEVQAAPAESTGSRGSRNASESDRQSGGGRSHQTSESSLH